MTGTEASWTPGHTRGRKPPPQGLLAKGSSAKASRPLSSRSSLTCCSSNSEEKRWVTDEIRREKEKEPPPYLGEQKCAEPGGGDRGRDSATPKGHRQTGAP